MFLIIFQYFPQIQLTKEKLRKGVIKISKTIFNLCNITSFKKQLPLLNWRRIEFNETAKETYDGFLRTMTDMYHVNFPKEEYIL